MRGFVNKQALQFLLPLLMLIMAMEWMHPWALEWLEYQRYAVREWQLWRLLTAHFVHLTPWHMAMNLASLIVVWIGFLRGWTAWRLWSLVFLGSVFISFLILITDPELSGYTGFSGVIYTLLVAGLMQGWHQEPVLTTGILVAVAVRLGWEQSIWYDPTYLDSWLHAPVYPNAHLFGAIAGGLFAFCVRLPRSRFWSVRDRQ
ncbi:rhombosortase [Marinobacter nauticus]|uniref:rhombosortase n=1 Tax=Marinobacter nauticus TaxID=2743 RepID=UPI004043D470